jgi:hypothetical protein
MANPILANVSTYVAGGTFVNTGAWTGTFYASGAFEERIPLIVTNPNTTTLSSPVMVTAYRSADLGATWETVGSVVAIFPLPSAAGQVQSREIVLDPGFYLLVFANSNSQTCTGSWSCMLGTALEITAYA